MMTYESNIKKAIAAISIPGGCGVIFNIIAYIKNQYTEDEIYKLTLAIIAVVFILTFCIGFIRPIVDWIYIDRMHKREIENSVNKEYYMEKKLGQIIDFKTESKLKRRKKYTKNIEKNLEESDDIKEE